MHIIEYKYICICVHNLYYFAYKLNNRFIITMVDAVMHYTVPLGEWAFFFHLMEHDKIILDP